MKTSLEKHLDTIANTKNYQSRGFLFQELLRNVLIESRFEVTRNPRAAKPRQTDLHANHDDIDFLIEAKWLARKIDVSDIDDLRARLQRVPENIIGCIFSMSEYAPTAIKEVERDRKREILLFSPDEIEGLISWGKSIEELIKRKRKAFRIEGKVWFSGEKQPRASVKSFPFPEAGWSLRLKGSNAECLKDHGTLNDIIFTTQSPEFAWNSPGGLGFQLEVTPLLDSISDLKNYLATLHNHLGLSSTGSFTVTQTECHWHGLGVDSFLKEAARWQERYEEARLRRIHHSEDLYYFDMCQGGSVLLTVRQGVRDEGRAHLHSCRLTIQLPGVPLDVRPFMKICEKARETFNYFTPLEHRELEHFRFREGIFLEPLSQIVSKERENEPIVCGLVVRNPFYNKKAPLPEGKAKYSASKYLASSEHLICSMSDWHSLDDTIDHYRLMRLEVAQIGGAIIIHPVCTWDNITNRAASAGEEIKALPSIESIVGLSALSNVRATISEPQSKKGKK